MLILSDLQRPYLSIPDVVRDKSWLESVQLSSLEHRWNHYLNQLTLSTLLPWLEDQGGDAVLSPDTVSPNESWVQISPTPRIAAQRWQWVTGTALTIGKRRLIVIPTDALDTDLFKIPQEWVDIPSWHGDYYLMVQLNPEAGQLQLRGYINHRQLKQGTYNEGDRTYEVLEDALVQDIDLLWVMAELEPAAERQAALSPLATLSQHQVNSLIQQFIQLLGYSPASGPEASPRLILPFESWASILSHPQGLDQLDPSMTPVNHDVSLSTQLSQWFRGNFDAAWQSWEQLSAPQRAWGLRKLSTPSISRGKRVSLGESMPPLCLWTTVTAEPDGRMKVLVQLRQPASPTDSAARLLPQGVELSLITPAEESLQVVTAQQQDDYIQLKRFKVLPGKAFAVEVRLGAQTVREQFRA